MKGRKVVEFGFIESGTVDETASVAAVKEEKKDLTPRGYWHAAAATSPVHRKIESEYGTDPLPEDAEAIPVVKQESEETLDAVDKAIQEPGSQQPEQVVGLVMGELAEEQGDNIQVIKAE